MFTGEIRRARSKRPLVVTLLLVGVVAAVVALVPMPFPLQSTFVLEPVSSAPVRSPRAGVVAEVLVKPGASVAKGTALVKFDVAEATRLAAELEPALTALEKKKPGKPNPKAEANLKKTEAALKTATAAHDKAKKASKGKPTPALAAAEKKWKAAQAAHDKAKADLPMTADALTKAVADTKAKLEAAKAELAAPTVLAPAAGVLKDFSLAVGAKLEDKGAVGRVEDTSKLKARVTAPPGEVLKKGSSVTLKLQQGNRRVLFDNDSDGDSATAEFDNSKGELVAGTTGKCEVEGEERPLLKRFIGK